MTAGVVSRNEKGEFLETHKTLAILVLVGGAVGALLAGADPDAVIVSNQPVETRSGWARSTMAVHVSGAVVHPGVVWVEEGSLVVDVIALAGGATTFADLAQLNLAQPVADGDHIHVPESGSRSVGADEVDGLIDINRADAAELETLPGVGPVLAARIVDYRESVGGFESIEDLLQVAGIGESILASIRELIRPP
ncbi:MAG: ComEA family DNA-binding protein [Acidimicrobiia bacterium]|nr:ComEA family DNA-binding protein [Acidimicrobiia bacterium]